jgi:predicted Zn finger-like uncharacterized protein
MIVTCTECGRRYNFDAAQLGDRPSVTVRCSNCKASMTVSAPQAVETPPAPEPPPAQEAVPAQEAPGDRTTRLDVDASLLPAHASVPEGGLHLLPGRRLSLAVLQGKDTGRIFKVERASVVIGRGESEISLDDPEVSRQHARLEVHGANIFVRDLGSTNGVFVDEVKVAEAELANHSEFRVGGTHLMLIVTEEETVA